MAWNVYEAVKTGATIYLADPVSNNPSVPPGPTQGRVNAIWGYALWVFAVVAALAGIVALITAVMNHQAGRPNDGLSRLGIILACCVAAGAIGGTVGVLTGT